MGWRCRVARVWITTPEACTLNRKTFGSQSVMKGRSNSGDRVPLRKVSQSRVGKRNLRRANTEIWICSENERQPMTWAACELQTRFPFQRWRGAIWNSTEDSGNGAIWKKLSLSTKAWGYQRHHYIYCRSLSRPQVILQAQALCNVHGTTSSGNMTFAKGTLSESVLYL